MFILGALVCLCLRRLCRSDTFLNVKSAQSTYVVALCGWNTRMPARIFINGTLAGQGVVLVALVLSRIPYTTFDVYGIQHGALALSLARAHSRKG